MEVAGVRKMWRDLESDSKAGENRRQQVCGVLTGPESPCSSSLEGESIESEETSKDVNEIENECPSNQNQIVLQNRLEIVTEKERVRKIFHKWGSKSFGGHTQYSSHKNNCSRTNWLGENELKRVRLVKDFGAGTRSSIRRIYGRQALLDLLTMFERERERELQGLLENQFVSNFAHRHRIQSLLKGRFLRNQRFIEDGNQTSSVAASELGLLKQTHAVSDRRKGFLSRLNSYKHSPEAAQSDNDMKHDHAKQVEGIVGKESETTNMTYNWESINLQDFASPVPAERHDAHTNSDNDMKYEHTNKAEEIVHEMPNGTVKEFESSNLTSDWESHNPLELVSPSTVGESHESILEYEERDRLPLTVEFTETGSQDSVERNQNIYNTDLSLGTMDTEYTSHVEVELEIHDTLQTSADSFNWRQVSTLAGECREDDEDDDVGWYQETERSDFQESHEEEWYDNDNDNVLEDNTERWFGRNSSYLEAALVSRSNEFYWSDDDDNNGSRRFELSELTNRRSVSNLLQSDFGTRLNHLMQSYVNRQQEHTFETENQWMQEQEQQQQGADGNPGGIGDVDSTQHVPVPDFHKHLTTEREIINGLRIDMNILQQRMNDMQKMLEACMVMQLELQRSVHQEVYPALNRSANSQGAFEVEDGIWNYQSKSSPGNGVCFLCSDDDLESLPPDRSVHMYICSKCAKQVNWSKLKESFCQT